MQFIKLVYEAFCRSLIRFFDNLFIRDTDVEYYRIEMEKLRQNIVQLENVLISKIQPVSVSVEQGEEIDWQPAKEAFKPWHIKQRELENESRKRAETLAAEAKKALVSTKSTEELEAELLNGVD